MRVPLSWLREYVPIKVPLDELAEGKLLARERDIDDLLAQAAVELLAR